MQHPDYCQRFDPKRSKTLFDKIFQALKRGKLYRDPNFTAQQLSKQLKINTRYIAAVVLLNTNNNFSHLLNSLRLADAERMLRTQLEYSAEEIGLLSGFGSRQSFYRVFLKHYGMTPRQYRIQNRKQSFKED
jgi:AraC-like DNA-binding protein